MRGILETAMANPWGTLRTILDGSIHPGGAEATEELLDRAGVTQGTRLLDVGCGAGEAVALARDRGADAVGVDHNPANGTVDESVGVRGDMTRLPFQAGSFDVVLAECVFCLAPNRRRALAESRRVLGSDGRLAVSDVVVEGELPSLPDPIVRMLCLEDCSSRGETIEAIEEAGFVVEDVRDHREELLEFRDRVGERVEYERLLPLLGERGLTILDGIRTLEAAAEDGHVGYVSLVTRPSD